MNREEAISKTVVSRVVSSIILDGDSTFWEGGHLLSPKIDVLRGLPNPPPERDLKWGVHETSRMNGPVELKHIICQKLGVRNYRGFILKL